MASAKLAKSTVNHSQRMIWNSNAMCSPPKMRSRIKTMVVRTVTTSNTNMTGFLISVRGSSFTNAEPIAGTTILRSNKADAGVCLRICELSIEVTPGRTLSERHLCNHREMLDNWSERKRGKIDQPSGYQDHADEQPDKQQTVCGESACG